MDSPIIALGIDVSKGHVDAIFLHQNLGRLADPGSYDDTETGHQRLAAEIGVIMARHPTATLLAGLEATGGYEANILAFLRRLSDRFAKRMRVLRLRGLDVRRFSESQPHRRSGDVASAKTIAVMLLERGQRLADAPAPSPGHVRLSRQLSSMMQEKTRITNQLLAELHVCNPEMLHFARHDRPKWWIQLLQAYPTASRLAKAKLEELVKIPHLGVERAKHLIGLAQHSVGALGDAGMEITVSLLLERLLWLEGLIDKHLPEVITLIKADTRQCEDFSLLCGMHGIGEKTAAILLCEIGSIDRFRTDNQLVSFAGLDPRRDTESGDHASPARISKQGNAHIRAALYMPALSAIRGDTIYRTYYERLIRRNVDKQAAVVAVMIKLLRHAFAILKTRKPFDPAHESERRRLAAEKANPGPSPAMPATTDDATPAQQAPTPVPMVIHPPISRRQARKRQKQAIDQGLAVRTGSNAPSASPGRSQPHSQPVGARTTPASADPAHQTQGAPNGA